MTESTILTSITVDELRQIISESVRREFSKISIPEPKPPDQVLMTRHEAIELLDISSVTLHNWMKAGKIRYRKIGRRVYFLKSEILEDIEQYNKL